MNEANRRLNLAPATEAKVGWAQVGQHEVWIEPDSGFVCETVRGSMTTAEMLEISKMAIRLARDADPNAAFYLVDARAQKTMAGQDRRKVMAELAAISSSENYVAVFGGNLVSRTFASVVFKGIAKLTNKFLGYYAAGESDARIWLAERRRAYLARPR
ncbi:MAG TPA: hypothetical protein VM580_28355 [Labilithrix sp.]|jgi:hypothetical protein|nr:hypothetical protein [Labilithrix sp.]